MANPRRKGRRERGQAVLELCIVLPVFIILTFGIIESGQMLLEYLRLDAVTYLAVRDGARTAMVTVGGTRDDYCERVWNLLSNSQLNDPTRAKPEVEFVLNKEVMSEVVEIQVNMSREYKKLFGEVSPLPAVTIRTQAFSSYNYPNQTNTLNTKFTCSAPT